MFHACDDVEKWRKKLWQIACNSPNSPKIFTAKVSVYTVLDLNLGALGACVVMQLCAEAIEFVWKSIMLQS